LGDVLVVGVEDLEVDAFVDDLAPVAAVFLVALAVVAVLLAAADPDVFATVLVGPEDEYLDGELELAAVVVLLLTTEGLADFVDEG